MGINPLSPGENSQQLPIKLCITMSQNRLLPVAYLGGAPSLDQKNFCHRKKIRKHGLAHLCVSISGQRKSAPLYEILNMPLSTAIGHF